MAGATDAEDLLQVSLVEALRSLPKFRGECPLTHWLDRVATLVAYKHFRSAKRLRARVRFGTVPPVVGPDPSERLEAREALARARRILGALSPDRRVIFVLVAVEGRTLEEAASLLGIGLSAAKARYLRARREVDERLAHGAEEVAP